MGRTCWQIPPRPRFETSGLAADVDKWYLDELKELSATATVPEFLQKRERLFELQGQGHCNNAGHSTRSLIDQWAAVVKRKLKEQQIFEELGNTFFVTLEDSHASVHDCEKIAESQLPEKVKEHFSYACLKNQAFKNTYQRQITTDATGNQLITEDPQEHLILDSQKEQLYSKILEEDFAVDAQDNDIFTTIVKNQLSSLISSDANRNAPILEETPSNNIEQTQLSACKPEERLEDALERDEYLGRADESEQPRDDERNKEREGRNLAAGDSNLGLDAAEDHREGSEVAKLCALKSETQSPAAKTITLFALNDRYIENDCINKRSILSGTDPCIPDCNDFHTVSLENGAAVGYSQDVQPTTVSFDGNQPPEELQSAYSMGDARNRRTDSFDEFLNGSSLRFGCIRDAMDPQIGGRKLPRSFSDLGCLNWSAHVNVIGTSVVNSLVESDLNGSHIGRENVGNAVEPTTSNCNSLRGDPMTNIRAIVSPESCVTHFTFSPMASMHTLYRRLAGSCRVFVNRIFCKRRIS